jgi:hypothetical protein
VRKKNDLTLKERKLKKRNTERRKKHWTLLPNANKKEKGKLKNVIDSVTLRRNNK